MNVVLILGMHRSGTSAVAGLLAKAGWFAGAERDLLAPQDDNPEGFFERSDVVSLNEGLLRQSGGRWDAPPARSEIASRSDAGIPKVKELLKSLQDQARDADIVVKDPRVCLLLASWLPALDEGFSPVLVQRHPVEVARSLAKRDGRPLYVGMALWQSYWNDLLDQLAGREVLNINYGNLITEPEATSTALLHALKEESGAETIPASSAGSFIKGTMRHQSADQSDDDLMTVGQHRLWEWLQSIGPGWTKLDPPSDLRQECTEARAVATAHSHQVADRHGLEIAYDNERHRALHFEQAVELKQRHIEALEARLTHLNQA